ncbi:Tat protein translocase TatC [Roseimicrobium gellanilyticum]|uniref:Sec-independent protein translocase protein TatC n=1 Tax=Roseimicrobium gellanilyticum TaxID=748857 RepID=A0A366HTC4_9BACT|nr:twin-arginine translocase subunit TatC [Roseimicrobium gellanilyticum]RBP47522.1 Tat protein translocase TatC [Roseimicrobium gellanilyticum]
MFNWLFKKVVTFREKVAVDLGQGDDEKPFLDHLDDLRTMIVRMAVTLLVMTLATFFFIEELMAIMTYPLTLAGIEQQVTLQNLDPTGGFMTAMNVALVASVILAFPILLYFLLQFVLPGLRSNEKKVLFPALSVGAGLFLIGVLFAYFVVSPRALTFFYEFSRDMGAVSKNKKEEVQTQKAETPPATTTTLPDLKPGTRITATTAEGMSFVFEVVEVQAPRLESNKGATSPGSTGTAPVPTPGTTTPPPAPPDKPLVTAEASPTTAIAAVPAVAAATIAPATPFIWELKQYVKFICQFILIFGACFELPVVVMALVKLDVLNYKVMKTSRSWAAIIICVAAALITPTQDAMTLGLLAVPMYILYEICIWLAWWLEKRDRALYPEYYKEQDEDEKALEVADNDWDNENYNPWGGGDEEEDEDEGSGTKPKPQSTPPPSTDGSTPEGESKLEAGTEAKTDAEALSESPSSESPATSSEENSVSDTSYSAPEASITGDSPAVPEPESEPSPVPEEGKASPATDTSNDDDDWSLKKKDKPDDGPTADKRDTD